MIPQQFKELAARWHNYTDYAEACRVNRRFPDDVVNYWFDKEHVLHKAFQGSNALRPTYEDHIFDVVPGNYEEAFRRDPAIGGDTPPRKEVIADLKTRIPGGLIGSVNLTAEETQKLYNRQPSPEDFIKSNPAFAGWFLCDGNDSPLGGYESRVKNYTVDNWPACAPPYQSPEGWEFEKAQKRRNLISAITIDWLIGQGTARHLIIANRLKEIL